MKIKPTWVFVILFIVVLVAARYAEAAGPRIGLGFTVANSTLAYGEVGYEFDGGYEITAGQNGVGDTRNGPQREVSIFSASRIVRPDWYFFGARNYYRIGVAYVHGSPLVGDTNFRLGVGLEWRHVQVEYFHYSSAGIHQPNTGIDGLYFRLKFD